MSDDSADRPRAPASPIALALALAASPAPLRAQVPAGFDEAWREVVTEHRRTLEAEGVVGGSVAIVHDGGVVAVDHYGMADLARDRPADDGTVYHWASVTKTLTAVALMQLVERGLVGLDDPAVVHVPELAAVHDPFGPVEAITLRHLLSHSAGFRDPTWPWGGGEAWHPFEPTEWSQLVALMPYTRIRFEPGTAYSYSNPGIIFVARALEEVTGDVYEAYVHKNLFRPLGMTRSYFDATPWHLRDDRADSYRVVEGRPVAEGPEFDTGITVSNGGLNAPVADLAKWVAFLLETAADMEDAGGGADADPTADADPAPAGARTAGPARAVLSAESLREMWRERVPVGASPLGPEAMGLSFFLYDHGGRRLIGHTGSQRGFRSFLLLDPGRGVGAIAVVNTAGGDHTAPDSDGILDDLRVAIADRLFPQFGS